MERREPAEHEGLEVRLVVLEGVLDGGVVEAGRHVHRKDARVELRVDAKSPAGLREEEVAVLLDGDADVREGRQVRRVEGAEAVRVRLRRAASPQGKCRPIFSISKLATK